MAKFVNLLKLFHIITSIPLENHDNHILISNVTRTKCFPCIHKKLQSLEKSSEIKIIIIIIIIEKKKLVEDIWKEKTKPFRMVVANKTVKPTRTSYKTIMYSNLLPLTRWNKQFHDIVQQLLTLKACLDTLRLDQFSSDWQGN